YALSLQVFDSANLSLNCTVLRFGDQNLVVELVDLQRNFVLNVTSLSPARLEFRTRNVISRLDLEELREGLDQPCATGFERFSTLIEDQRLRRNGSAA